MGADDVAPLHQPHPRCRVDALDRRADQVAAVGLAAGADLDLGGNLMRLAGGVGQFEQERAVVADRQRRVEHEPHPGGARVDQAPADV